jgi:hypothetical protein
MIGRILERGGYDVIAVDDGRKLSSNSAKRMPLASL